MSDWTEPNYCKGCKNPESLCTCEAMTHEEEVERIMLDAIRVKTDARNLAFPYLQEGIEKMKALVASAEKKGREERYILKAEIDQAWNEAIEAAENMAITYGELSLANKIKALKKGQTV